MVISLVPTNQTPPLEILTIIFDFLIDSVLQKFNYSLFRHYPAYFLFKTMFQRLDSASILMLKRPTQLVPIYRTSPYLQHHNQPNRIYIKKLQKLYFWAYIYIIFCLSVILKVDRLCPITDFIVSIFVLLRFWLSGFGFYFSQTVIILLWLLDYVLP